MKKYLNECWLRAKECIILVPFVILPLLCYGVARGSETKKETKSENYFLPDTVKVEAVETPPQVIEEKKIEKETPRFIIIERGTVYNPEKEQCQGDPWQPAHGPRIDSVKLSQGKIRWCALSADLLEIIPYGSVLKVHDPDKKINGIWEVHDRAGIRSTIDFLYPSTVKTGKWDNLKVEIIKLGKGK